ncbi:MAG: hypothetical protein CL624_09265 [Arcobacter sp.]|nr:hypothetical protein [Arcobacter sp.]
MNKLDVIEELRNKTVKMIKSEAKSLNIDLDSLRMETLIDELNNYHIELYSQNDELQLANKRLEHTSKLFNAMFYEAPVGYILLDDKYRIIEINTEGLKILNLNKINFSNLRLINFIGKGQISKFLQWSVDKSLKTLEIKFHINSTSRWLVLNKNFWEDDSEYIFLTIRDITKEKELEKIKIKENRILSLTNALTNLINYWDKPLFNLSSNISFILDDLENNRYSKTILEDKSKKSIDEISILNNNLNKFRALIDFNKLDFDYFNIHLVLLKSSNKLLKNDMDNNLSIHIDKNLKNFEIYGNSNQFSAIIYKILNFLKYNIMFVETIDISITTEITEFDNIIDICVYGAIDENIINLIYENLIDDSYLDKENTLEISISKIILEYQLNANLEIKNSDENCIVRILIPRKISET